MMLLRTREAVMQPFRRMLKDNGLTEQQWRVLRALDPVLPLEVSGLARSTFLLGPSLSRILPELTSQRLIQVATDERDQRRKLVRLSPAGQALIESIAPVSESIYQEIAARFGAERLADLQSLLLQLEADLLDMRSSRGAGEPPPRGRRAALDSGRQED